MKYLITILLSLFLGHAYSQVAINTNGSNPDSSAMLDIQSDSKGVLIPRVTLTSNTDQVTIEDPAEGLLVYNTGDNENFEIKGFVFWNGKEWRVLHNKSVEYNNTGENSPEPEYYSTSFIGRYFDQEENGIKLGDFCFRFYVKSDQVGKYTVTDDKIITQIKYVGTKSSVELASMASGEFERELYSESGSTAFGLGDVRNTNVLQRDVWYGWGGAGIETRNDIEKRQYTLMSTDPDEKYFYFCEFMVVDYSGTNFGNTKVFMHVKMTESK
ncbi:MAG: hypothetical protein LBQ22_05360 [Bacteroidales bacterium]|nr:hypothetical protein [Bacteroidales bacterium]